LGVHCQQNLAEQPYCFSGPDGNPRFKKIPLFLKILKLRRSSFFRPQDFRDHLEARSGPRFQKCRFEKFAVSEQVFGTPTEPEQSDGVVLTIAQLGQFLCCKDFLRRFLWYKILRHKIFRVVKKRLNFPKQDFWAQVDQGPSEFCEAIDAIFQGLVFFKTILLPLAACCFCRFKKICLGSIPGNLFDHFHG
jgi:hypothetical protein